MTNPRFEVPLLDLKTQHHAIRDDIERAIRPVIESQQFVLGPGVSRFEEEVAAWLGAPHAIGCSSGTDALFLALMAFDIGPGDEVIAPTFTFFATGSAIARLGATPVFCDIDPATYNLSIDELREKVRRCTNLRAILPVHLYGQAADLDSISAVAGEKSVPVIEDAAQAIGARDGGGALIGSKPLIHCFSCYPTKNLGAWGDAGFITTHDETLAEKIRLLRVHGAKDRYHHDLIGVNARLDALQAAVLRAKLPHLHRWNEKRRKNAAFYDRAFADAGALASGAPWTARGLPLRYPQAVWDADAHAYHQYVIRVPAEIRDDLRRNLSERGIGNEVFYPVPLHLQNCFRYLGGTEGDCPNAEQVCRQVIALPIHSELSETQLEYVAETVTAFVEERTAVRS